jgi:hypothetical protein
MYLIILLFPEDLHPSLSPSGDSLNHVADSFGTW